MTRRTALSSAPAAAAMAATGCATTASAPSGVSTYITAIANGLSGILGDLSAIPGLSIPPAVMTQIQTSLTTIETDAGALGSIVTTAQAGTVQSIVSAVEQLAHLLQPILSVMTASSPTASFVLMAVQAALSLLPVILSSIGVKAAPSIGGTAPMDPDTATAVLHVAAKKYGH